MSLKQQKTSMIENLESRQFLSAAPTVDADAALAAGAGKVSMQDFHFVMKVNKPSPELKADVETDSPAGISIVAKPTKSSPGLAKVRFNDIPIVS